MVVISLIDRLGKNDKDSNSVIKLKNYFIDDVEVSALNFIFPYQDIKVTSIEDLLIQSIVRPVKFCASLYDAGVYSQNQMCPWGDSQKISQKYKHPDSKVILLPNQFKFYQDNIEYFKDDSVFFRDCLNQYIQGFLDDFNGVPNLPFHFSPTKNIARKVALKNKNEGILEVISTISTNDLSLGFIGIDDKFNTSQTRYYKNKK
jgi:hypothetical protein